MARFAAVFALVPRFSMIALYGAVEPLRVANRFAPDSFSWRFVSADGAPVSASNGIPVSVSGSFGDIGRPALAVFCASYEPERGLGRPLLSAIRRLSRAGVQMAGIDTGPFLLARAGVLDGYRATCHWESLPGFRESFPAVQVTEALYEVDRDRMTCAGGSAAIDMMLAWIGSQSGPGLAVTVADQLLHFRTLDAPAAARPPAQARYGTKDRRLLAVIAAMEAQTEEPHSAAALAVLAGVSPRQLERLFRRDLGVRPMGFYQRLRLEKAERLLTYSRISVRDAALACGFSTLAHFSRAFRAAYGKSPSAWRDA